MSASNFIDLTGNVYGRLTVLSLGYVRSKKTYWVCSCECGSVKTVYSNKLKTGHTKSCGCLHKESVKTHGLSRTRIYRIWHRMKNRAGRDDGYEHVSVCRGWLTFEGFYKDMGESYFSHVKEFGEKNTTINRIKNTKGYTKENCEWATYKVQNNNTSFNVKYFHSGELKTIAQWYETLEPNLSCNQFRLRLRSGMTVVEASSIPSKKHRHYDNIV